MVKRRSPFSWQWSRENGLGVFKGKSLMRRYGNAQSAVHMFKQRKQTGCDQMTGLHALHPQYEECPLFFFPFASKGNSKLAHGRARKRLLRRAHASESRNAFLHSPSRGCIKFASRVIRDWIFYRREIELRVLSGADHLPSVKYSQDFYSNIVHGLFLRVLFSLGKRGWVCGGPFAEYCYKNRINIWWSA